MDDRERRAETRTWILGILTGFNIAVLILHAALVIGRTQ